MTDAELDLLHASLGIDRDGSWPASHAISSGDLLLQILHEGERQLEGQHDGPVRIGSKAFEVGERIRRKIHGGQSAGLRRSRRSGD